MAVIATIRKKINLETKLRQKWINACKREKNYVKHGIHEEKCIYLWKSLCDRYAFTSEQ